MNAEEQAESANLRARAPFDKTAAVLEETLRALMRSATDIKFAIHKAAAQLVELEGEAAAAGEAVGSAAAAKIPRRPKEEKSSIPWCSCSMWTERHVHHDRHPVPDEVLP